MAGYAVYRDGTFLELPHITIEVADSCSGLNQMISSIALGIPIAFTILNQWWKRVAIILFSMMLGLVMNWVRVVLIAIWNYASAKEVLHGPYGIYELPFIFLVGVFITLAVAMAMADKTDARAKRGTEVAVSGTASAASADRNTAGASVLALLVLSVTAIYLNTWKAEAVELHGGFSDFPMTIAGFQGKPIDGLEKPFYTGLAQNEFIAGYVNQAGETAKVYIGYFPSQNQQEELIDYRYNWLHDGAEPVELSAISPALSMKRNSVRTGDRTISVFFSYDINGRNIVDPKRAKLASVIDALLHRHNNGAIVIVIFDNESIDLSDSEQEFLTQVMLMASARLPGG
jgi:EpsI family protein